MLWAFAGVITAVLSPVTAQNALPAVSLGDRPGDVESIKPPGPIGPPALLADGRLMLWATAKEGDRRKAIGRFSSDNGSTWSAPQDLFQFPAGQGEFTSGAILVSREGTIHLFGLDYYDFKFRDKEKSKSLLWHARSTDGGKTWSPVQHVPFGYDYTGSVNGALQLDSGRILVPISAMDFDRPIGVGVSVAPYSDDDGVTWHPPVDKVAFNTGAADWYESGAHEPVAIQLRDGRVWMLPRSQDGYQWESFSKDGGLHWSPPRHTRFVSNQSAMAVLRLADGRLMLFWDNCEPEGMANIHWGSAERAVMAAAVSADEGKTWVGYREVARITEPGQVSYPYAAQAADGRVILFLGGGGRLIRIDPAFLTNTTFREEFSSGIARWSTLAAKGAEAAPDPDGTGRNVLRLRKPDPNAAAGASLNFPFGSKGRLTVVVRTEPGFQGAQFTVADHYALPGLPRDGSFPFRINAKGTVEIIGSGGSWVATPGVITPGTWYKLALIWDCSERRARLLLDDTEIAVIEQFVCAPGICYLRLRSMAEGMDEAGMYVRSVAVKVAP